MSMLISRYRSFSSCLKPLQKHLDMPKFEAGEAKSHWYPGHMEKSLRAMKKRIDIDQVSCIFEVRDARIPLSCINWKFEKILNDPDMAKNLISRNAWGQTVGAALTKIQRFIVYNKCDLIDANVKTFKSRPLTTAWQQILIDGAGRHLDIPLKFSSVNSESGVQEILLDAVKHWVNLHKNAMKTCPSSPYPHLTIMVLGLPNTGKSSLINALRVYGLGRGSDSEHRTKVAAVGKNPGFTRNLSGKIKVLDTETPSSSPSAMSIETPVARLLRENNVRLKVYVIDSPGILPPYIPDEQTAMKLALTNCLPTDAHGVKGADPLVVAEYLWWRLCRWSLNKDVLRSLGMSDLTKVTMMNIAAKLSERRESVLRDGSVDISAGALHFLKLWRQGFLYQNIGLMPMRRSWRDISFGATSESTAPKVLKSSAPAIDRWKYSILDEEFELGSEAVSQYFSKNYGGTLSVDNNDVSFGNLKLSAAQTTTSRKRRMMRRERETMQ